MARIEMNPLITKISGSIGSKLVMRHVGRKTYLSAKPRRWKGKTKARSTLQTESSLRFKAAVAFSKKAIKIQEIKDHFKQLAVAKGGTNNAYTMLNGYYLKTPGLTLEKLQRLVRTAKIDAHTLPEQGLEFFITASNGDTIAHGIALPIGKKQWSYTTPITGLQVIIKDRR